MQSSLALAVLLGSSLPLQRAESLGTACGVADIPPVIRPAAPATLEPSTVAIEVSAPPWSLGILVAGTHHAAPGYAAPGSFAALGPLGLPGCSLEVSPDVVETFQTDGNGRAVLDLGPSTPALFAQAVVFRARGGAAGGISQSLRLSRSSHQESGPPGPRPVPLPATAWNRSDEFHLLSNHPGFIHFVRDVEVTSGSIAYEAATASTVGEETVVRFPMVGGHSPFAEFRIDRRTGGVLKRQLYVLPAEEGSSGTRIVVTENQARIVDVLVLEGGTVVAGGRAYQDAAEFVRANPHVAGVFTPSNFRPAGPGSSDGSSDCALFVEAVCLLLSTAPTCEAVCSFLIPLGGLPGLICYVVCEVALGLGCGPALEALICNPPVTCLTGQWITDQGHLLVLKEDGLGTVYGSLTTPSGAKYDLGGTFAESTGELVFSAVEFTDTPKCDSYSFDGVVALTTCEQASGNWSNACGGSGQCTLTRID